MDKLKAILLTITTWFFLLIFVCYYEYDYKQYKRSKMVFTISTRKTIKNIKKFNHKAKKHIEIDPGR